MKYCLKVTQWGAGYVIWCTTCRDNNVTSVYHGATGRTLYSRFTEHTRGHQKTRGNALHKHDQIAHDGNTGTYSFELLEFFQDPREITEGVRKNLSLAVSKCILMNSTEKFTQGSVPRIEIARGLIDWERLWRQRNDKHNSHMRDSNTSV